MIVFAVAAGATVAAVAVAVAHATVPDAAPGQLPAGPQPGVALGVLSLKDQHQLKHSTKSKASLIKTLATTIKTRRRRRV